MDYLFNSQVVDSNGKPLQGGRIRVLRHGTTELATIYTDFQGHLAQNPYVLDSLGHGKIVADDGSYDLLYETSEGQLLFSVENVTVSAGTPGPEPVVVVGSANIRVAQDGNTYTVYLRENVTESISALGQAIGVLGQTKQDKLTAGEHITIEDNVIEVNTDDFYTVTEADGKFTTKAQLQQVTERTQEALNTKQGKLLPGNQQVYIDQNDKIYVTAKKKLISGTDGKMYMDLPGIGNCMLHNVHDSGLNPRIYITCPTAVKLTVTNHSIQGTPQTIEVDAPSGVAKDISSYLRNNCRVNNYDIVYEVETNLHWFQMEVVTYVSDTYPDQFMASLLEVGGWTW